MTPDQRRRRRELWADTHGGTAQATSIRLTAAGGATTLDEGGTLQLTAVALDDFGVEVPAETSTIVFSSSDAGQATVNSSSGLVTAVGFTGPVTITATGGNGIVAHCILALVPDNVAVSVAIDEGATFDVAEGGTTQLHATCTNQFSREFVKTCAWVSGTPANATVGAATGLVTAAAGIYGGTTIITVTADVGVTDTATGTVTPDTVVATVNVTGASGNLAEGGTIQLTGHALNAEGRSLTVTGTDFTWASDDEAKGTVDTAGLVTAVGYTGTFHIRATRTVVSAPYALALQADNVVVTVAITGGAFNVDEGSTKQLAATASNAEARLLSGKTFTWASGTPSKMTVDTDGLVTAAAGQYTGTSAITATCETVDSAAATGTLVADNVTATVTVTPTGQTIAPLGTKQFDAAAKNQWTRTLSGKTFVWASSDEGVATVDSSSGLATGVGDGTCNIGATTETIEGHTLLTVAG